jgi:hypothetical protein
MKSFSTLSLASLMLSLTALAPLAHADQPLVSWSESVLADIKSPTWSEATCIPYLTTLSQKIDKLGQTGSVTRDDLKAQSAALTQNLWKSRIALHDRLAGASNECAMEIRNTFRKFRFLEDFLSEIAVGVTNTSPEGMNADLGGFQGQPVPLLDSTPDYLIQSANGSVALQEGDVMIARGVSFLSAMIARLGDVDSQFSHAILVVRDPETQLLETIESYVGEGVNFHELKWALKNENSRLLILRPKNQELAKKVAADMWKNVHDRGTANHIYYDYGLNFDDHSTMSCVELIQVAFLNGSNGEFKLPERPSTMSRGRDLLTRLGVTPGNTFTPGDLEYDSRFDMVGEYRDLRMTRDSRLKDSILTKMLEWMDQEHYTLHPDLMARIARGPVWTLRHTFLWPVVRKILGVDDFSREIPRSMVGTVKLLGEYGEGVQKELQKRDDAHFAATGLYMTYNELYDALEQMKTDDLAVYSNRHTRKNSILIKYLRPQ